MTIRNIKISLTSLILGLFFTTNGYTNVDEAIQWLSKQQNETGAFLSEGCSNSSIPTSKALLYLDKGDLDQRSSDHALTYLNDFPADKLSTEQLAERILLNHRYNKPTPDDVYKLLERQQRDGSFSAFESYFAGDILSTIATLPVLRLLDKKTDKTIQYLFSQQTSSGAWTFPQSNYEGLVSLTTSTILALENSEDSLANDALIKAKPHLDKQLFKPKLDPIIAAEALLMLIKQDQDITAYNIVIKSLIDRQQNNGSFENDVHLTAVMIQLLNAINKLNPNT